MGAGAQLCFPFSDDMFPVGKNYSSPKCVLRSLKTKDLEIPLCL